MKKTIFKGSAAALVTPMDNNQNLNLDEHKRLIDFYIENKTDALVVAGTTGEASTLSMEEYSTLIDATVKFARGRVPVIAGAGSNNTLHAVELSKIASSHGADALLQVTPYYNKTSQSGLIKHFTAIADSTNLPVILYNVPSRTGVSISATTYKELSEHPNIVATKDASGDFSLIAQAMQLCGDNLDFYSGNDDQIVPMLALGAKGVISVLADVMPEYTYDICQSFFDGKHQKSAKMQLEAIDIINALFCDVNPIPVKYALSKMGYSVGNCRLPLDTPSKQAAETILLALENHNLI